MDINDLLNAEAKDVQRVYRSIVLANPNDYPNLSLLERRKNHYDFHHSVVDNVL